MPQCGMIISCFKAVHSLLVTPKLSLNFHHTLVPKPLSSLPNSRTRETHHLTTSVDVFASHCLPMYAVAAAVAVFFPAPTFSVSWEKGGKEEGGGGGVAVCVCVLMSMCVKTIRDQNACCFKLCVNECECVRACYFPALHQNVHATTRRPAMMVMTMMTVVLDE